MWWLPGRGDGPSVTHGVPAPPGQRAPGGAEEQMRGKRPPTLPAPRGHAARGTPLGDGASDAGPGCSSRPGAAGSGPRPGLCDLRARS